MTVFSHLSFSPEVDRWSNFSIAASAAWLCSCEWRPLSDINVLPHCLQACPSFSASASTFMLAPLTGDDGATASTDEIFR